MRSGTAVTLLAAFILMTPAPTRADVPSDLHVKCPAGYSVYVDGQSLGKCAANGSGLMLNGLLEGSYTLRVDAGGKTVFERTITIDSGESISIDIAE